MTDLHREHSITLVLVTHDAGLAEKAQRRIRLLDGSIEGDEILGGDGPQ